MSDLLSVESGAWAGGASGGVAPLDDGSFTPNVTGTPGFGASLASLGVSAASVNAQGVIVCDARSFTELSGAAVGVLTSVPNKVANGSRSGSRAGEAARNCVHASIRHNTAAMGFVTDFAVMTVHPS